MALENLNIQLQPSLLVEVEQNDHQFNDIFVMNLFIESVWCSGLEMYRSLHSNQRGMLVYS